MQHRVDSEYSQVFYRDTSQHLLGDPSGIVANSQHSLPEVALAACIPAKDFCSSGHGSLQSAPAIFAIIGNQKWMSQRRV